MMITLPSRLEYGVNQQEKYDLEILKKEPLIIRPKYAPVIVKGSAVMDFYSKGQGQQKQSGRYLIGSNFPYDPQNPNKMEEWMKQNGFGIYSAEEAAVADALAEIVEGLWRRNRAIIKANRVHLRSFEFEVGRNQSADDSGFNHNTASAEVTVVAAVYGSRLLRRKK